MTSDRDIARAVKMRVRGLVMDPNSNMPVVILENDEGSAFLPIWIGVCEANSIALVLEGVAPPRPMTHDLVRSLVETAGCTIEHVFIHSLEDSVFKASIQIRDAAAATHQVDSRPSDAIAIALRVEATLLVDPSVLEQAVLTEASQEEALRLMLEKMRPEDLGDYEM